MTDEIKAKFVKAYDEKRLLTCKLPDCSDLIISLEQHMVEDAMDIWRTMRPEHRAPNYSSIRKKMKRATKRVRKGKATGLEMDALAADLALWLGHEMLYADGERHLVKPPSREVLLQASAPIEGET